HCEAKGRAFYHCLGAHAPAPSLAKQGRAGEGFVFSHPLQLHSRHEEHLSQPSRSLRVREGLHRCFPYFSSSRLCSALPCTRASAFWAKRLASWSAAPATSAPSLRKLATRPASSSPRSTAARTAQPGSFACRQSRNRHCAASASMSAKLSATSSSPVGFSSRMPGVSIRQAPDGSAINARWVVVWRPRSSPSRTAPVFILSMPSRVLVSVDLPAPEEPTSTAVRPGRSHCASAATLARSLALTASTG